jgi:gliding motility-associated-like protein
VATLTLNVTAAPAFVTTDPAPVCEPATVNITAPVITAGSSAGLQYSYWLDTLATIPLPNPNAVAVSGSYFIKATSTSGCPYTGVSKVVVDIQKPAPGIRYPDAIATANVPLQLNARDLGPGSSYNWKPQAGLNSYTVRNPIFTSASQTQYTITITTPSSLCPVTDTILVKVKVDAPPASAVYVPKGWTPNGDGKNDKLYPLTVNITELKYFRVYNRWGELVFATNVIGKGWDGMYKGQPQSTAVFVWIVEAIGGDGQYHKLSGSSVLIR